MNRPIPHELSLNPVRENALVQVSKDNGTSLDIIVGKNVLGSGQLPILYLLHLFKFAGLLVFNLHRMKTDGDTRKFLKEIDLFLEFIIIRPVIITFEEGNIFAFAFTDRL